MFWIVINDHIKQSYKENFMTTDFIMVDISSTNLLL